MSASFGRITRCTAQTDSYATGGVMSVERHGEELMAYSKGALFGVVPSFSHRLSSHKAGVHLPQDMRSIGPSATHNCNAK